MYYLFQPKYSFEGRTSIVLALSYKVCIVYLETTQIAPV